MTLINANMKHFILITLLYISVETIVYCQSTSTCGSKVSDLQQTLEKSFIIPQITDLQNLPQANNSLYISAFIVANNPKNTKPIVINQSIIQKAIDDLQSFFAPIALTFKLKGPIDVPNYQLNSITLGDGNEVILTGYNHALNVITLYLVDSLYDSDKNNIAGYAYMPGDNSSVILMEKSALNSVFLAHQIGHSLGLYHTHETIFGDELVSRSAQCDITGDRCCDTEADPNLTGLVSSCLYIGNAKDKNNSFYSPSAKNIMSYSNAVCQCTFTTMQFNRMVYYLNKNRKMLY